MNSFQPFGRISRKNRAWIFLISAALLVGVAFAYFSDIIIYLLIAFVISMIGRPMVKLLDTKLHIPNSLSCVITIFVFACVSIGFLWLVIPLISKQINAFQAINYAEIGKELSVAFSQIQHYLWDYGLMASDQTIEKSVTDSLQHVVEKINFEMVFSNVVSLVSNVFIGVFSIVFVSFFFLKDQTLFFNMLMAFVPQRFENQAQNILSNSQKLLTRYFAGLLIEVVSMMILLSTTMWILGVKNAILLGFLGGLLNIIPYLGPVIGAVLASSLAYTAGLSGGFAPELFWIPAKVVIAFSACNLIDNFLIQPVVYSKSVKAHPLEIFLVIMMAGSLAGVKGMIFAIPVYTLARIIAKEFFKNSKLVGKLTRRM